MHNLNSGGFSNVRFYSNFNQPLPKFLLTEAIHLTYQAIQQVRDGGTIESVAFNGRNPIVNRIHTDAIAMHLNEHTRGALLTYQTKNNSLHQLLFFNKGNGKCVIQDPNRFTIDNIDIADGKRVLTDIIRRSNQNHVVVAKDPAEIRSSKL